MTYQFRPAERGDAPLMLGIAGPSRSGKTYSALRVALGMTGDISKVFVLDTERGRSRQYVDRFGQFMHCDLEAPFTSEKYQEAIADAEKAGAVVIIVDSQSHEHEGPGGILEQHETELTRMAGATDWNKRERMKFSAWIKPKAAHNKFVNKMLQVNVHMIFCFRAKDKLAMVKNDAGKMEPVSMGWQPICADRFEYEMTGMLILPPGSKGTPDLDANAAGLREPLDTMFKQGDQLTEETGKRLIKWANNGHAKDQPTSATTGNGPDPIEAARAAARGGSAAFQAWWNGPGKTTASRAAVKPHMKEMQDIAAEADAGGLEDEDPLGAPAEETEPASGETEGESPEGEAATEQGRGRGPEETPVDGSTPAPEREAADSAGQSHKISARLSRLKGELNKRETQAGVDAMLGDKSWGEAVGMLGDDDTVAWRQAIDNRRDEIEQIG